MKKGLLAIILAAIAIIISGGIYYKSVQMKKAETARIAKEKQVHDEYENIFKDTLAGIRIQRDAYEILCKEYCSWLNTGKIFYDILYQSLKENFTKDHVDEEIQKNRDIIADNIKKLLNPPADYKSSYELLLEMYGILTQLHEFAMSPSGLVIRYRNDTNDKFSEFDKNYNKVFLINPALKEEKEKIEQRSELIKKIRKYLTVNK